MSSEGHCGDVTGDCAFFVRSADEDELVDIVMQHASSKHDMDVSREDARGLVQEG